VTYDGVPQVDPAEYRTIEGHIGASTEKSIYLYLADRRSATSSAETLEEGYLNAQ